MISVFVLLLVSGLEVPGLLGEDVAFQVLHRGEPAEYWYSEHYPEDHSHHVHSVTKSVTGLLTGIAIERGLLPETDTPLSELFPGRGEEGVTLHHLLSMSSGISWQGGIGGTDLLAMLETDDWTGYVLDRPSEHLPGTVFNYNSGGTHLLSVLIQREFEGTAADFAGKYLFSPLGITEWSWDLYPAPDGVTAGAWGLHLTVHDMALLGELVRNGGAFSGRRIVTEDWVNRSTSVQFARPDCQADYGYQWWLPRQFGTPCICARGWYGDHYAFIYVFPDLDLVVAAAGANPDREGLRSLIREYSEER